MQGGLLEMIEEWTRFLSEWYAGFATKVSPVLRKKVLLEENKEIIQEECITWKKKKP